MSDFPLFMSTFLYANKSLYVSAFVLLTEIEAPDTALLALGPSAIPRSLGYVEYQKEPRPGALASGFLSGLFLCGNLGNGLCHSYSLFWQHWMFSNSNTA